jgi:NAD-dependent deacetylase
VLKPGLSADVSPAKEAEFVGNGISLLRQRIAEAGNIVFFGGAGVSTESGIPDFRSADGLYSGNHTIPPETVLSHGFLLRYPEEFYRFYHKHLVFRGILPNQAHRRLAELAAEGKLRAVVTQTIDGLHQAAGSKKVLELHGSTHRCYCMRCGRSIPEEIVNDCEVFPRCDCGGVVRPDVVLYGEGLDPGLLDEAIGAILRADLFLVGGSSLTVYPAAGLVSYCRPGRLVLINRDPTPFDGEAALVIRERIGEVFAQV